MTQTVEPPPPSGLPVPRRRTRAPGQTPATVANLCPLLLADDGAWRTATATREHRCAALGPDVPLTLDKQRRLCLRDAHTTCATYSTAMRLGPGEPASVAGALPIVRPYPRMAPVVLDHGRLGGSVPRIRPTRSGGQMLLAGLMATAFGVFVLTRLAAGDVAGGVAGATSPVVAVSPSAAIATDPPPTVPPVSPTPTVTAAPATPAPSPVRTYTVRRGDTLSGIAGEFGTTVKAIMDRNGIDDPRQLRVGAVLELP